MRVLVIFLFATTMVSGQGISPDSVPKKESRYFFSARAGLTLCAECDVDGPTTGYINIVQGIRLTPGSRLGVGTGLMSASRRVIVPLFGSLKIHLGTTRSNKLFIETNVGGGAAFRTSKNENYWTETVRVKSFFQPSVGYSIKYHDLKIGITMGMQWLNMVSTISYPSYGWIADYRRSGTPNTTEFKYNVSRMIVGLSIGWRD